MEKYQDIINAFYVATVIISIYMICYMIKGKENGLLDFFKTLFGVLGMYVSLVIPITLVIISWKNMSTGDYLIIGVIDIAAVVFSTPFFVELIKCIDRDFYVPFEFKDKITTLLVHFMISIVLIIITVFTIAGFANGVLSISALLAGLTLVIGGIVTMIVSIFKNYLGKDTKEIEATIGLILAALIGIVFFIIVVLNI